MNNNIHLKNLGSAFLMAALFAGMLMLPELAFAQGQADAGSRVKGFINKLNDLLNIASIAIVTMAVIFAGYQIAFAHKRISDVAPILIGGFLIGAAAQLAKLVIPDNPTNNVMLMVDYISNYA
ncbi:MAG: TrbC/VirB2 family protein [Lysobacter sp.]